MQPVNLTLLLKSTELEYVSEGHALSSFSVQSFSTDTRSLKKGDVFVALTGERFDGHSFIKDALEGGAKAVLFNGRQLEKVHPFIKNNPAVLFLGVRDTRSIFGMIAERYLDMFSVTKVVVTGSAGKTTTKGLIASVLSQNFTVVSSIRSYNNEIGVPKTLLEVDGHTNFLVQELGTNHPGEITALVERVHPDAAVITNIGPAHIGHFGSEHEIAREKKEAVLALDESGTAFLNADDRYFHFLRDGLAAQVKSYGIEKGDVRPERINRISLDGSDFVLSGKKIQARVIGEHGIRNSLAAAAVGMQYGVAIDEIKKGIEAYRDESGRGNVQFVGGITIIDESYNANPLSVLASLSYLSRIKTEGRKVLVFADMLELGDHSEFYHRKLAERIVKTDICVLYAYGPLARITGGEVQKRGERKVRYFCELEEMIRSLKDELSSGDIVLVQGSRKMGLERVVEGFLLN